MDTRSHVSLWLAVVLWPIHRLFMRFYFRISARHRERLPRDGAMILAPTHRSRWDSLVLCWLTRRPLRFLTSRNDFVGIKAWFMRRLGAFPVNTARPGANALRHCFELIEARLPLVFFPEGTIYYFRPGEVHPLKPGLAWLALDAQEKHPEVALWIVPIRLVYGDQILKFRSRIEVVVQEPIDVARYMGQPRDDAKTALTADVQKALGEVVNESSAKRSPMPPDTLENKPA
jgi:1-acyl-sn-glycerol-3-phosphate acyltransferase